MNNNWTKVGRRDLEKTLNTLMNHQSILKFYKSREVKSPERVGLNAGFDFFIPNDFENKLLMPNESVNIPSGIKVKIPHGYALIAFNKSGIAAKYQLIVGASIVDENYIGEIHLNLINTNKYSVMLKSDMKIVQFALIKVNYAIPIEIYDENNLYSDTDHKERGDKGFGSTGL
jgi:dUTP pyrophosphatase